MRGHFPNASSKLNPIKAIDTENFYWLLKNVCFCLNRNNYDRKRIYIHDWIEQFSEI